MTMAAGEVLLLVLLIGAVCGLRSMTGPALVSWGVYLRWLHVAGSHVAFMGSRIALVAFSICAVGELIADKFSGIPNRTDLGPLTLRVIVGAICGGALAVTAGADFAMGCMVGALGGLLGAFVGFWMRRIATRPGRLPDFPVALIEDLIAVGGGLLLISRF